MGSEVLVNGDLSSADSNCLTPEEPSGTMLLRNAPSRPWVVQKFGGTCVGKLPAEIAENIVSEWLLHHRVAVVCSARSSGLKADGTTNLLLRAAREAENHASTEYNNIISNICRDHIEEASAYIRSPDIRSDLILAVEKECAELSVFLAAAQRVGELSPRMVDTVISKGEILSCLLISALLRDRSIDAEIVDLSSVIQTKSAELLDQEAYKDIALNFEAKISACSEKVPVITGYFGKMPGGLLQIIGRGYTDLCAALVAVGLHAEELQVWKEVDGIFTADPSKVPTASLINDISPAEAAELTFYGSEVIHPFTMEQAISARVPIRIRNVRNLRNPGTRINPDPVLSPKASSRSCSPKLFRSRTLSSLSEGLHPRRPTALTVKRKILVLNVHSNKRSLSHGFFANIFSTLDKWRLSVDLISTSEVHVSMALHSESPLVIGGAQDDKEIVNEQLRGAVKDLAQYGTVDLIDGMAILSLVGRQMKNMIGVAGKMFSVLGEHNVNIEMISQGASEINISCVISERDCDRAMNILHTYLFTFLD